jgi:O-antigen ligase
MIIKNNILIAIICILIVLLGHAVNNTFLLGFGLLAVLSLFVLNYKNFLPLLFFFLPFAPILKINPGSVSVYAIAALCIGMLYSLKIRFRYDSKILLIVLGLVGVSILAKYTMINSVTVDYFVFIFLILIIPNYIKTYRSSLNVERTIAYFVIGVVIASIASQQLMSLSSLQPYINVYQWEKMDLTRLSGFYGDANYHAALILAAINSLLILLIKYTGRTRIIIYFVILSLIYLGSLTVSKSFILFLLVTVSIWLLGYLSIKGETRSKLVIIPAIAILSVLIMNTTIFQSQFKMYQTRFSMTSDTSSLTTGRSEIFQNYYDYLVQNQYSLILGQGYSQVYYNTFEYRASHNTIIQTVYQFGIIGFMFIIMWFIRFNTISKKYRHRLKLNTKVFVAAIFAACYLPWMALDMLFFDEFILITALFLITKNFIVLHTESLKGVINK